LALNKTFTCNTIFDEDDNAIECYYQGYHVRTGTWNDVKYTEEQQYNCNLGDGDWLTQDGEVLNGDLVILNFWVSDEDTRSGLKDRMCSIIIEITSDNTYVNDVKLKPKTAPVCGFSFDNNEPTINNELNVYSFASDNYSYTFNEITHYHYRILENELIFDSIDKLTIKYDFDEGDGWVTDAFHTYSTVDEYTVSQRATNLYDISKICSQQLKVRYNIPIPGLSFDYINPIHTTESTLVIADITDIDSRITNIKHKIVIRDRYSNDIIEDTTIEENAILDYEYDYEIQVLQKHYFTQLIYWNDGFDDLSFTYNEELIITNWCPEVTIIKSDITDTTKIFVQNSSDRDGEVVKWLWEIYFVSPFSNGEYNKVYEYVSNNPNDWEVGFTVAGEYKVRIIVTDDYGCEQFDETKFNINTKCSFTDISNIKFIFPKQLGNH